MKKCKHCTTRCKTAAERTEKQGLPVWVCPQCDEHMLKYIKIDGDA